MCKSVKVMVKVKEQKQKCKQYVSDLSRQQFCTSSHISALFNRRVASLVSIIFFFKKLNSVTLLICSPSNTT